MAGSLSHLVDETGAFTFDLIDDLGDAREALQECVRVIAALCGGDMSKLVEACAEAKARVPAAVPVLPGRASFLWHVSETAEGLTDEDLDNMLVDVAAAKAAGDLVQPFLDHVEALVAEVRRLSAALKRGAR